MKESTEKLYQEYLKKKLDEIFVKEEDNLKEEEPFNYPLLKVEQKIANHNWKIVRISGDFAIVKDLDTNKYSILDSNGELLINDWYSEVFDFSCGYALVRKHNAFNYIDKNCKYITNDWFQEGHSFKNGLAEVRIHDKWFFIDTNGKLINNNGFDRIQPFCNGYALVINNNKWNYIDTNGELISNTWYDEAYSFDEHGLAIVKKRGHYYCINVHGVKICDEESDSMRHYNQTYKGLLQIIKIGIDNSYLNYIDRSGKMVFNHFIPDDKFLFPSPITVSDNFYYLPFKGKKYLICSTKNMKGYVVKKTLSGYRCSNPKLRFYIKYEPLLVFDSRYTLCLNNEKLYLYDRIVDEYMDIGDIWNIEFTNNLIFDHKNNKVYFIYEEKLVDITNFYESYFNGKVNYVIKKGSNLLTKEEFALKYNDLINSIINHMLDDDNSKKNN